MFSSREPKSTAAYCHHVLGFRKRWVAVGESTNSVFLTPGSFGRWEGCTRSFPQSTSNQWGGRRKIQLLDSLFEQPEARDRLSEAGLSTFLMSVCCFGTDVGDLDFKRAAAVQFKLTVLISNHSLDIFLSFMTKLITRINVWNVQFCKPRIRNFTFCPCIILL